MTKVPRIWFFEGLDKTGKTTLCRACRFSSGHAAPMYDRGFLSREVFYEYNKESNPDLIKYWRKLEAAIRPNYGIVYLEAPDKLIQERHKAAGEYIPSEEQLILQRNIFRKYILQANYNGIPVIYIRTDEYGSVLEAVKHLLEVLQLPFLKYDEGDFQCKTK